MMGSAVTAVTTHRRGENLLLVFSYLIRAASLQPFGVPTITDGAAPIKVFSLFVRRMLTHVYQSIGWVSAP